MFPENKLFYNIISIIIIIIVVSANTYHPQRLRFLLKFPKVLNGKPGLESVKKERKHREGGEDKEREEKGKKEKL